MGTSKLTTAAVTAFAAFVLLYAVASSGAPHVVAAMHASAAVALPLAVFVAGRTVVSAWRGPVLVQFPRTAAVVCFRNEAERVRTAAQLRGSLGGAGHVHRGRLAFPAAAWVTAAVLAGSALEDSGAAATYASGVLALALAATVALPARPFWYREARDGAVLVHPRAVCSRLAVRQEASEMAWRGDANGG